MREAFFCLPGGQCLKNKNRKVLVIGNGFDLEHGLPTSYNHFLRVIKDPDGFYKAVKKAHDTIIDGERQYLTESRN